MVAKTSAKSRLFQAARITAAAMGIALAATSLAGASDSGTLSYRANRSLNNGKFAKAYGQMERALLASRKEADLISEGRILIGMAQVRIMSLDFDLADSLLSVVRPEVLDNGTTIQLAKARASLLNAKGDYRGAAKACASITVDSLKQTEDATQATFYSECAIAQAGTHQMEDAEQSLKMVGKRSSKKSGFYAFTAARMADLSGDSNADSLYRVAEAKAIQANKPYNTATILYHRSQLKSTKAKDAEDLKSRCKHAFELMGLPNNSKRCAE